MVYIINRLWEDVKCITCMYEAGHNQAQSSRSAMEVPVDRTKSIFPILSPPWLSLVVAQVGTRKLQEHEA